ncbi:methyl-accepting chemotaxis protein [Brevibacillus sp. GCM10020057]|uniref:methyl-accepting chemotaxis protein n=1 Tax=Brevibacillus sp. GCM10020057 TaxID=3317327 RepID=UPI0036259D75
MKRLREKFRSLQIRFLGLFVVILVVQLVFSMFMINSFKKVIQQDEVTKSKNFLESKTDLIGSEFGKIGLVGKLASSTFEQRLQEMNGISDELLESAFQQKYLMANGLYGLDDYVAKTKLDIGNARIDKGPITLEQKKIIMASESFDGLFATIKKTIPESQWYYFTTEGNFQKIYPFVDNKEGKYVTSKSRENAFYTIARPENNPGKEVVWTEPYKDDLGSGMMVTASIPIYAQDKFYGVFSVDISLSGIEKVASSFTREDGSHAIVVDSGKNILTGATNPAEKDKQSTLETDIKDPEAKAWMEKVISEKKDSDLFHDSVDYILAKKIASTGWYIFMYIPTDTIEHAANESTMLVIWVIAFFIVGILVILVYMSKRLKALRVVRDRLGIIASGGGDLTGRIHVSGSDEIRQLADMFNDYLDQLESMIANIKRAASSVVSYSNQLEENIQTSSNYINGINQKSHDVLNESTNISAVTEELSAAVEEIAATTRDNLSTLDKLVNEVMQIKTLSENSEGVANKALSGMENIESEVTKSVDITKQLEESMKRIREIVTTMTDISSQTNLLALNASIEAARAGEAGKGFSVVAEEVRKLAEESKKSSDNINEIIGELQSSLRETIEALTNQSDIIMQEKQNVLSLIKHMSEIKGSIETSSEQINTFQTNADAQADGTDSSSENLGQVAESLTEVTTALANINENIQNQTDIQANMSDIAGQMKATSEQLHDLVKLFVVREELIKQAEEV